MFDGEGGKVKRLGLDLGPVQNHRDAFFEQHVIDGPAGEADGRGLSAEKAGGALRIEAAAGRHSKHFGDACRASDGNVLAGGKDGFGGNSIGVEGAGFAGVDRGADGGNFAESHLGDGIEQAWIDLQAFGVDDLRSGGNLGVGTDGRDFAVANDHRTVIDWRAGQREDFGVSDGIGCGFFLCRRRR